MGFGAATASHLAGKRVSVQQSRPAWQPDGFRCSNPDPPGSQTGFGAVIAANWGPDSPFWPSGRQNGGAKSVFPLFLQRNTQANPALAGADGVRTAPKPVSLPMDLPKLHRNAFFCHRAPALHRNPPRALGGCATSYTKVSWLHARGPAFYSSWDPAGAIGTSHSATMAPVPDGPNLPALMASWHSWSA